MKTKNSKFVAIVPAAGIGKRMASECPKQYLPLAEKTIIEHTLSRLIAHAQIDKVVVALHPEDSVFAQLPIARHGKIITVTGGDERADSVLAGLNQVVEDDYPWVLVHDAARPCLTAGDIDKLVDHCLSHGQGAVLATPVRDTMKRTFKNGEISHTESRDNLWHALTPQMYLTAELKSALTRALAQGVAITDESSAMEWAGLPSSVVVGRDDNLKITRPNDLALASFYLTQQQQEKSGC